MADRALGNATWAEEELFLAEKAYGGACRRELVRVDYSNRSSDRV